MLSFLRFFAVVVLLSFVHIQCRRAEIDKGDIAPEFTAKDLDGNQINLSNFKGKLVLLHFWADCCIGVRAMFPQMQEAYETLSPRGFELVAINAGQWKYIVKGFRDEFSITFPMLLDESLQVTRMYNIRLLPTNFLISEDGKIIDVLVGWVSEESFESIIEDRKLKPIGD